MDTHRKNNQRKYRTAAHLLFEPLEMRILRDSDSDWWPWTYDDSGADTQPVDTQPVDTQPTDNSSGDSGYTGDSGDSGSSGWDDGSDDYSPPPPPVIYPPDAPSHVTLQSPSSSSIFLTWSEDSDDVNGFQILRFDRSGRWHTIATVGGGTTQYTDTHLTAGSSYTYSIVAFNDGGYSDYSPDKSFFITDPSDPTLIGEFGKLPGGPASVPFSFIDTDGTQITLTLSGSGTGMLHLNDDGYDLALDGTTLNSSLNIKTNKTRTIGDDGRFDLTNLTTDSALGNWSASTTDLLGDVTISGGAKSITLGNLEGGNVLTIGAPSAGSKSIPSLSLRAGTVNGATLNSAIGVSQINVTDWINGGDISATYLNALSVAGNKTTPGDFDATIELNGAGVAANRNVLGSARISGNLSGGPWTVGGNVGSLTITGHVGADTSWQLSAASIQSLSLGDVQNAEIAATGAIGSITAQDWLAGDINATALNSLRITGRSATRNTPAITGNFSANITLTGSPQRKNTLNQATIASAILNSTWLITGNVGTLAISNKTTTSIGFSLTANALQSLAIQGNLASSQLTLSQLPDPKHAALGQLTVHGTLSDFVLRSAGNIGSITAGMLDHTLLFAGVLPNIVGLPRAASDFELGTLPSIASVSITGLPHFSGPVLINSDIAAGTITRVTFPKNASVSDVDNDGLFGFATVAAPVKKYAGPISSGNFISGSDSAVA